MDKLVSLLTKESKYIVFDNDTIKSSNGLDNLSFTEDGTYYVFNNVTSERNIDIVINEGVNVNIIEFISIKENANINCNINCKANSSLELVTLYESNNSKAVINANTVMEEKSYFNSKGLSLFMSEVDSKYDEKLVGEKAKVEAYNVFINNSEKTQDFVLNTYHNIKETESMVRNFAICKGTSTLNINTNGIVINGSKQSNISQKTKGILLSSESGISANPLLQIDEYDCLASHGAGIGAIDEEDLFYLMSRGLTKLESEKLIIGGFVNPIYEAINNEELRNAVLNKVSKYL